MANTLTDQLNELELALAHYHVANRRWCVRGFSPRRCGPLSAIEPGVYASESEAVSYAATLRRRGYVDVSVQALAVK